MRERDTTYRTMTVSESPANWPTFRTAWTHPIAYVRSAIAGRAQSPSLSPLTLIREAASRRPKPVWERHVSTRSPPESTLPTAVLSPQPIVLVWQQYFG